MACSFSHEFVVVNESSQPVDVQYRVKESEWRFSPPEVPATLPSSELKPREHHQWIRLAENRYRIDPEYRTVSVRLLPGEALLIATLHNNGGLDGKGFPLDRIEVRGINGVQNFTDSQVVGAFSDVSMSLHTLNYR
jgi:hypothetical protein